MIISRTPFRISFVGGGSDLESYYKYNGGKVISTSIDKYIYLTSHNYFDEKKSLIKYSKTEIIKNINEIKHPIIRSVFEKFDVNNIDFNSIADIPAGTGMGSSSSFTVGLIKLCAEINKIKLSNESIAKMACEIEIDILKEPIGKQDQYAAAIGGINEIEFKENGNVIVNEIKLSHEIIKNLEGNLKLFYTGINRSASAVLNEQKSVMSDVSKRQILDEMVSLVPVLKAELIRGRIDEIGPILNESWILKKSISNKISSTDIDNTYKKGISCGATGGKLLGAGAGGFILFYIPTNNIERFNSSFNILNQYEFKLENNGTQIIYNNEY